MNGLDFVGVTKMPCTTIVSALLPVCLSKGLVDYHRMPMRLLPAARGSYLPDGHSAHVVAGVSAQQASAHTSAILNKKHNPVLASIGVNLRSAGRCMTGVLTIP
jgi:hypothetical protein